MDIDITPRSLQIFLAYAGDAKNWGGISLWDGNVRSTQEDKGNLTQLKKAGLVTTWNEKNPSSDPGEQPTLTWIEFTQPGRALAAEHGIEID